MLCIGLFVMWCQSAQPPAITAGATFCQVAKPMYWSAGDTRRTKEQADRHNRIGKKLCGWGASK